MLYSSASSKLGDNRPKASAFETLARNVRRCLTMVRKSTNGDDDMKSKQQEIRAQVGEMIDVTTHDGTVVKRYRPEVGQSFQIEPNGKGVRIYKCKYPSRHWTFVGEASSFKAAKRSIDVKMFRKAFGKAERYGN
jgi:hypothetical protein